VGAAVLLTLGLWFGRHCGVASAASLLRELFYTRVAQTDEQVQAAAEPEAGGGAGGSRRRGEGLALADELEDDTDSSVALNGAARPMGPTAARQMTMD